MQSINFLMLSTFAAGARRCGVNLSEVLSELGIDIDMSSHTQGRLSLNEFKRLFDTCQHRATRGYFPLSTGDAFAFEGLSEIAAFVNSSPTFRDAFRVFEWSPQLIHPALHFRQLENDGRLQLAIDVIDPMEHHHHLPCMVEMVTAVIFKLARDLAPTMEVLKSVQFKHGPQTDPEVYQVFFKVPVTFNAGQNTLEANPDTLDVPLVGGMPSAHRIAFQAIQKKLLTPHFYGSVGQQLVTLYRKQLSMLGSPLEDIAQRLDIHPRTLQRKLREEGCGFSELQNRIRHELACEMLARSVLDIESISIKLGFSDRRSFTSAFSKWEGCSPLQYRQGKNTPPGGA